MKSENLANNFDLRIIVLFIDKPTNKFQISSLSFNIFINFATNQIDFVHLMTVEHITKQNKSLQLITNALAFVCLLMENPFEERRVAANGETESEIKASNPILRALAFNKYYYIH